LVEENNKEFYNIQVYINDPLPPFLLSVDIKRLLFVIVGFFWFLVGCQQADVNSEVGGGENIRNGRILVWHSWGESGSAALEELVTKYQSVHPDVTIVITHVEPNELKDRFMRTAALGLGPDLMIGPSDWLLPLIEQNTIAPIDLDYLELIKFNPAAVELATYNRFLYGVPLSLKAPVLYANKNLTDSIQTSYESLLEAATEGEIIAISINARTAYSGIEAFGAPLIEVVEIEEMGSTLRLNSEGFIAWVTWLKRAQENPNIIISNDEEALAELFRKNEVAAYLGPFAISETLLELNNGDGDIAPINLAMSLVPKNDANISRPLIQADLIYFNQASSARQQNIALSFSDFLSSSEQGNFLLRELNIVPANQRVRIARRVYPFAYAYGQSARTAVAIPIELEQVLIGTAGNTVYTAILSGAKETDTAFCDWQVQIEAAWNGPFVGAEMCEDN
jgi:arabinogalactan oligomer/maltooligosaccharide transport system substrate-binding protein